MLRVIEDDFNDLVETVMTYSGNKVTSDYICTLSEKDISFPNKNL